MRKAALSITVVAALWMAATPVQGQPPDQFPVQYMVKFVCGFLPPQPAGEEGPLKPGDYATAVNILNYTTTNFINGSKRFALHYRDGTPWPPKIDPTGFKVVRYRVLEMDCPVIWAAVGLPPGTFVKGMVHIGLPIRLPVAAVYTAQTDPDPTVVLDSGAGISIDVENYEPFIEQLPP